MFLATSLATTSPLILGIRQPWGLHWNWVGKLACVIMLVLLVPLLPPGTLQDSGLIRLPSKSSARPVFVVGVFCTLLGLGAGVAPESPREPSP